MALREPCEQGGANGQGAAVCSAVCAEEHAGRALQPACRPQPREEL